MANDYKEEDKKALKDALREYKKETTKAKAEYYTNAILAASNTTKKVFDTMQEVSNPECLNQAIVPLQALCDNLTEFSE
ncbi:hypothetical protein NDU88_001288 [Pleurodeles waltl]|uniref:Uncharacterized protein n=1 Tax=Pleurodeles waltl TaxID=8319 RepID=A0AAV7MKK1_PLEWA|nr:hypothetical protein NDU88_001288 [Pleurodeles waltl]